MPFPHHQVSSTNCLLLRIDYLQLTFILPMLVKILFQIGKKYRLALYATALGAMFGTRYGIVEGLVSFLPRKTLRI